MKYIITNIYKYTATVEVEAESEKEAREIAIECKDEPNNDDYLCDCKVQKVSE